jgi:hypothetical protein
MPIIGSLAGASSRGYGGLGFPSSGLAGDFVLLGTVVATGSETNMTFNNITSSYKNLFLVTSLRSSSSGDGAGVTMRFNNDTASNYTSTNLAAYRQSTSSSRNSSIATNESYIYYEVAPSEGNTTYAFGSAIIDIVNYTGNTFKHAIAYSGYMPSNPGSRYSYQQVRAGNWRNTNAVTRIDLNSFGSTFISGSKASLYGVK